MKRPLPERVGLKFIEWGRSLMSWTGAYQTNTIADDASATAASYVGPGAVEMLARVPTVYRCVMRKALDKARVPLVIGRQVGDEFKPMDPTVEGSPAHLFASVNPTEGPASFRSRLDAMIQLTGDGMVLLDGLGGKRPREMWLLPSTQVEIVKGPDRKPAGYVWTMPNGTEKTLTPEQVFHTRLPNPASDWRGLSPLRSTTLFAWMNEAIAKNQVDILGRGGVVPGWLKFGDVPTQERADLKKAVQEQASGKSRNQVGILWDKEAAWIPAGLGAREGEFLELLKVSKQEIASAFGVPVFYLNDMSEASYSNAYEQKESYWFNTIIPELELLAQDITEIILWQRFGDPSLVCKFDYEQVEAIQDLRLKRAESLQRLVAGGLFTQNEAREELGRPRASGGDVLFQPQVLQPTGVVAPVPSSRAPAIVVRKWIDDPTRHEKRVQAERDMASFVPDVERRFKALADRQEARLLSAIDKAARAGQKDFEESFDFEGALDEVRSVLLQAYIKIVGTRGQAATTGVDEGATFDLRVPGVNAWMEQNAAKQSKLIIATEKKQIAQLFADANNENLTSSEIATRITELFDLRRSEALRIAWTETGKAYNYATVEGWKQSEVVTQKEWLSARDGNVRTLDAGDEYDHAAMDGVVVGLDDDFTVPGAKGDATVQQPGEGPAGNAINCRCTTLPVVDEALKAARRRSRLIPRIVLGSGEIDELFAPSTNGHTAKTA